MVEPAHKKITAINTYVPRVSCLQLHLSLQEAIQDQQVGLTQHPI